MDAIDKKILSLLGQNARIPLKKIAEQVFLSPPAVSARIERMESSGIITGYRVTVAQEKLGYHITAFVNVVLPPERQEDFYACVRSCQGLFPCCSKFVFPIPSSWMLLWPGCRSSARPRPRSSFLR